MSFNEVLGICVFWLLFIGVIITFVPMHNLGLNGMQRRVFVYPDAFEDLNFICSLGSYVSFIGMLF